MEENVWPDLEKKRAESKMIFLQRMGSRFLPLGTQLPFEQNNHLGIHLRSLF